jgi:hypothetical protein
MQTSEFLTALCEDPYVRRAFAAAPQDHVRSAGLDTAGTAAVLGADPAATYRAAGFDPDLAPKLVYKRH